MSRPQLPFDEIKKVSIDRVATMLKLKPKPESGGFRCPCPCGGGGDRAIRITNAKGWHCHACKKSGFDCISFAAHQTGQGQYEAAEEIARYFRIGIPDRATSPAPPQAEPERGEVTAEDVLPLLGLSPQQCEELGLHYSMDDSRLVIPMRAPDGKEATLTVSLWDTEPLLLVSFEETAPKDEPKPVKRSLEQLRAQLKVVGGN